MHQAHYDDPDFFYDRYWQGRSYEHKSEELALSKLLPASKVRTSLDIGGGYGRLTPFLTGFSDRVILVEPSQKQLDLAKTYLSGYPRIKLIRGTAEKTSLPAESVDLAVIIRVFHHLPQPEPALRELYRILKPGGLAVIEFANSTHFKARVKRILSGQPLSAGPVERRSRENIRRGTIQFVNHHPHTFFRLVTGSGFRILTQLSVSNFRSPFLKKIIPLKGLLVLESWSQPLLSRLFFGPSIFILARKS